MGTHFIVQATTDPDKNTKWYQNRIASGIALLFGFLIHFIFLAITYWKPDFDYNKDQIYIIGKKMYLFGIAGLLSCSYLEGSAGDAVLSWITVICLFILHFSVLKSFQDEKKKYVNFFWVLFYSFLFFWYLSIVISFF